MTSPYSTYSEHSSHKLSTLADVTITDPLLNGEVVKYDTSINKWVNSNTAGSATFVAVTDDNADATFFPTFVAGESINAELRIANAGITTPGDPLLSYNPNIGTLKANNTLKIEGAASGQVAVGFNAGQPTQGDFAVAVGYEAGNDTQLTGAVAIGIGAGKTAQLATAVAIGRAAAEENQQTDAIAIGNSAARTGLGVIGQGQDGIAIGHETAEDSQGAQSIAIGQRAGRSRQGVDAIAIGRGAGLLRQGAGAVSIGRAAGDGAGVNCVAIGLQAGALRQGTDSIAIGQGAGTNRQPRRQICINASGVNMPQGLPATNQAACYINPIRSNAVGAPAGASTNMLWYSPPATGGTAEVAYKP